MIVTLSSVWHTHSVDGLLGLHVDLLAGSLRYWVAFLYVDLLDYWVNWLSYADLADFYFFICWQLGHNQYGYDALRL